jgi:hypothetical protein
MAYKSDLEKIFHDHTGNIIHKWNHYFEIYDRHFSRFRNRKVRILEIGVYKGGSLQMWQKYFGADCEIYAIDINPLCKKFEEDKVKIFIGSQEDRTFLNDLRTKIPPVDILIDDGGHMMNHLKITFEALYELVKEDGVYLAEDLHTCYWPSYAGGFKRKGSFIEYCKGLIDQLNAWHSQQRELKVNEFTKTTHSIHFYDSIVVFEKRKIEKPFHLYSGKIDDEEIVSEPPKVSSWKKLKDNIYKHLGIDLH